IFIDEIDSIMGRRDNDFHEHTKNIKNLLLGFMDGTEDLSGVVFVGATNRLNSIDSAFLRPGRMEHHFLIDLPHTKNRIAILKLELQKNKLVLDNHLTLEYMAQKTKGQSPAEMNR